MTSLDDPSHEKAFLDKVYEEEDKNYHAWSYRIWFVQHFNLYDGELEFITDMLSENPLNNSAWSYRYFIVSKTQEFSKETVKREVEYALEDVKLDNEAAWVSHIQQSLVSLSLKYSQSLPFY